MIEIKPPTTIDRSSGSKYYVFLGGSIEMGKAVEWQKVVAQELSEYDNDLVLCNPRRDDWDSSWAQDPTPGTPFHSQVTWELQHQDKASINVYYFDPNTISPITLLELGSYGSINPDATIVCCPKEYFRYGNVAIFCHEHNIMLVETLEQLILEIKNRLDPVFKQ
jgi:hypothetical protein